MFCLVGENGMGWVKLIEINGIRWKDLKKKWLSAIFYDRNCEENGWEGLEHSFLKWGVGALA